jgi:glutamate 5-kinase
VALLDPAGQEVARGLINYDTSRAAAIAGKRKADIRQVLGDVSYDEVVHRDNLVVTR